MYSCFALVHYFPVYTVTDAIIIIIIGNNSRDAMRTARGQGALLFSSPVETLSGEFLTRAYIEEEILSETEETGPVEYTVAHVSVYNLVLSLQCTSVR